MNPPAITERTPQEQLESGRAPKFDREFWLVLAGLTALYATAVSLGNRRFVWFDELFTFDIARAPTIHRLWEMLLRFDCNPPTSYLLSRFSMSIFGQVPWALRLPSMVEFYFGSVAIFMYVRRRAGAPFGALAVLILWASEAFFYAVEARPYALLFMCCAFLLLSWDTATRAQNRRLALWGVALSTLGLFSAHAFAPFSLFPFLVAEAVRFWRRRKPDYALWSALLVPTVAMILYIPLSRTYKLILFPREFQASFPRLGAYFYNSVGLVSVALLLALVAALLVAHSPKGRPKSSGLRIEDLALLSAFVLSPVLLTVVLMHRKGAFWDRYGLTTQAALYAAFAIVLGWCFGSSRRAGYAASLVVLGLMVHRDIMAPLRHKRPANVEALVSVKPGLPIVDASMLTFFEMNHYESPGLLSRLYYLRDRAAAVQYAHATMFEDFEQPDRMKPYFPIPANVDHYDHFVRQHRQFLVFGSERYPEDWLLPKLQADGAHLSKLGSYPGPYKDSTLYLVTLPNGD